MLILPLHQPLTRATFPIVTMLLVLVNAFVFLTLQGGDTKRIGQLQRFYVEHDLGTFEIQAYEKHLRDTQQHEALAELRAVPAARRAGYVAMRTLNDVAFSRALHDGALFEDATELERWRPLRSRYEALRDEVFTLRHIARSSEADPWRMFASAFLHGDVMHLIGNMIFLMALGLLVEGALGPLRFLGVYLLGAMGASLASLWWRWGDGGGGLGASGAIAALMGAFCVVWGRQPVRFFYWFGVVFDYVRAPAIWLLPVWLGWEVYNLLANDDLGIGFDAHAGGLVSGALLGAVLVATGQVRDGFIRDAAAAEAQDTRWERAQAHLGRMQLVEAEALLDELAREQPQRFDVRLALYRAARNAGRRDRLLQRARELLALTADDASGVQAQREALAELEKAGVVLNDDERHALLKRWIGAGALDAAEALLDAGDVGRVPAAVQAQLWFELALGYRDRQARQAQARVLRGLVERHPEQPQAVKARFLLEHELNGAG
ncbi:rhomboid family protein [Luteimonas cucumeris]|uniref:Rhomboid family protein n=1 Tax=Luteimonas cucumeris TaxID=985012 RepID=A0A562L6C9_9GAMM|nr:rhomboid family intramembrane serine protease [Luteimonas cucumeris]TWI03076.1 rhomboid family protein [Luteimonas cucumeris]